MKAVIKLRDCNTSMDLSRNGKIDLNKMENYLKMKKCIVRLKKADLERLKKTVENDRKARRRVKKLKKETEKTSSTSHKKRARKRKNVDLDLDMKSVRKKRRINTDNDSKSQIERRKSNKIKSRKSKDTKSVKNNKVLRNKKTAIDLPLSDSKELKENGYSEIKTPLKRKNKSSVKEINYFKSTFPEIFNCIIKLPRVKLEDAERLMVKSKKKSVSFLEEVRVFGETDDEDSYDEEQVVDEVNDYHDEFDGDDVNIIGGIRCVSPSAQKLLEKRCSTPIAKSDDIVRLEPAKVESPNVVQNSKSKSVTSDEFPVNAGESATPDENLKKSPSPVVTITTADEIVRDSSTTPLDSTTQKAKIEDGAEFELISDSSSVKSNCGSPSLQLHVAQSDEKTEKIYNDSKDSFVTADEGQNDSDIKDLHTKNSLSNSLLEPDDGEVIDEGHDNVLPDNLIKINGIKQIEQEEALINQNYCEESIKVSIKLNDDKEADVHNNNKIVSDETTKEIQSLETFVSIESENEEHEQIMKNGNNICNESVEEQCAENNSSHIGPPETLIDTTCNDNETSEHPNSTSNNNYDENVLFTVDNDEQSSSSSVRFNLNLSRDSNEKNLESSFEKVFNTELNSLRANSQTNSNNDNSGIAKENEEVDTGGGYVRSFERQMSFDDLIHDQTRKLNNISDAIINNDAIMGSPRMIGDDDSNSLLTAPSTNFPKNLNMESQDSVNLDEPLKLSESDVNDDLQDLNEINKALGMDPNGLDDCDHTKDGSKTSGPGSFSFGIFKTIKNKLFPQTSGKSISDQNMNSNDKFPDLDGDNILDLLNINDDELLDTNLSENLVSTKPDSLLDDEILCSTEFTISK